MSIPESELSYGSILTLTGENAEINGKLNNKPINFTHIAIGDANDVYVQPSRTQTTLVNEITRIPVTGMEKITPSEPDGVPLLKVWAKIPDNTVDIAVREFAAVATFDGNSYIHAVGNTVRIPILSGSNNGGEVNDIFIEMTFAVTSLDPVVMIDPAIVTATRKFVEEEDAKHVSQNHPHKQYLRILEYHQNETERDGALKKIPLYPEVVNDENRLNMSLDGTTLTIEDNQILRFYGWLEVNTSDYPNKSFHVDLEKAYHVRFNMTDGFHIKDVSSLEYNPDSLDESDKRFDTSYDDMNLALVYKGLLMRCVHTNQLSKSVTVTGSGSILVPICPRLRNMRITFSNLELGNSGAQKVEVPANAEMGGYGHFNSGGSTSVSVVKSSQKSLIRIETNNQTSDTTVSVNTFSFSRQLQRYQTNQCMTELVHIGNHEWLLMSEKGPCLLAWQTNGLSMNYHNLKSGNFVVEYLR
ncbi:hypothetical protein GCM10007938_26620 [Vibrio zhanjiangensis]|uniref:Phage tail fibre protein N-terminal domain-containing protein n=1 Tax=Vibrio zhanjiangensis TaxID=1046128 RepID=A0ABQ6F048_9VIBR|nr:phage tail protein [Vibrio zhanjiangensis]GLT18880.1 hypothetical protein GCM10007938_26620 [Vibrio zhanjiangensis]